MELTREEFLRLVQDAAEAARRVVARDTERLKALQEKDANLSTAGK
jgi:hypothetical protein